MGHIVSNSWKNAQKCSIVEVGRYMAWSCCRSEPGCRNYFCSVVWYPSDRRTVWTPPLSVASLRYSLQWCGRLPKVRPL